MGRPLLAGNWKLNPLSAAEAIALARGVLPAAREYAEAVETVLCPPFCWLTEVAGQLANSGIGLGAQDCYWEPSGAFTGEVSAAMLAGWCGWVIAGHSERRAHFGEDDATVARKVKAGLEAKLQVIGCVGESEPEHDAGETVAVVGRQLQSMLEPLEPASLARLVIAYEPVWAIGTGRSADPQHADMVMRLVGSVAADLGGEAASSLRVLYGGSVNAGNVADYAALPRCDGCLVGGASLKPQEFSGMIARVAEVYRGPRGGG